MSHRSPCVDGRPLHRHLLFSFLLMTGSIAEAQFTTVFNVPPGLPPISITSGTQLNILEGGQVGTAGDSFSAHGGEVNLLGGSVGHFALLTDGAHLNMHNGSIGQSFSITNGSRAIIHNGTIGSGFHTQASSITIGGGQFGGVTLGFDSVATISGGVFDQGVHVHGSDVTIHDATIHSLMRLVFQSTVDIYGGSFPEKILVQEGSRLNLYGGTLNKRFHVSGSSRSSGEATANIYAGEVDMQWSVGGQGVMNVYDGTLKSHGAVGGGVLNVHGGTVGDHLEVFPQGTLNLDGGKLGDNTVLNGTTLITGGQIGAQLQIGGTASIYGGTIGPEMSVMRPGVVNIHGGTFGDAMHIDGNVTIYATSFELDVLLAKGRGLPKDTPVEELLVYDHPYRLRLSEDATLKATLEDGSPFELNLFRSPIAGHDFLDQRANIYLVLVRVPEPATILLGLLMIPLVALVRRAKVARGASVGLPVRLALFMSLLLPVGMASGQFTTVINVPPDLPPISITSGTQLNISAGGQLGIPFSTFTALGGEVNISGGAIDAHFASQGDATTNISGGHFTRNFLLDGASQTTISGGVFDANGSFRFSGQSALEITGGDVYRQLNGSDDAQVTITGGRIFGRLNLHDRAQAALSGGLFDSADHWMSPQSSLLVEGGDFRIDGVPIDVSSTPGEPQEVPLGLGQYFSATLADGSPFVYHRSMTPSPETIRVRATPPPAAPTVVTIPSEMPPLALRDGQTLNLGPGGELGSHFVVGWNSTLNVSGGQIGPSLHTYGARVDISGGTIGPDFHAEQSIVSIAEGDFASATFAQGTVVDIAGGDFSEILVLQSPSFTLGDAQVQILRLLNAEGRIIGGQITDAILVDQSSKLTLEGGLLSGPMTAMGRNGSEINILGGTVAGPITVGRAGALNIHGGTFTHDIRVERDVDLTIYGTDFVLDQGQGEFESLNHLLEPNTHYLLDSRSDRLLVTLADGTPFELDLFAAEIPGRDYVDEVARVYLVLAQIPEPATASLTLLVLIGIAAIRRGRHTAS